jgi:hypothetical protein
LSTGSSATPGVLVKRVLAAALLACGLAAATAPAAQAAPLCGPVANVNCAYGSLYCRVWIAATRTCIHT